MYTQYVLLAFHLNAELAPSNEAGVTTTKYATPAVPMPDPKTVLRRRRWLGAGFTLFALAGIAAAVMGVIFKPKKTPVFVGAPSISMSPSPQPSNAPSVSLLPSGRPSLNPSSSMSPTSLLEGLNNIVAIYPETGVVPDPETPQFKALVWLSENQMLHEYDQDELRARYAISTWVFTSNRGANTSLSLILTDASHCKWPGITCGPQFNSTSTTTTTTFRPVWGIRGLDLFQGKSFYFTPELAILSNTLKSLIVEQDLYVLEIYDGGTIPSEFGMLTELTDLTIDGTNIQGTIPSSLGSLTKLQKLVLSDSEWTGELPALGLLTNLEVLDLSLGRFLSKNTIPTEIGTF
jgi:Leucine-rich repeat (LRR) protein